MTIKTSILNEKPSKGKILPASDTPNYYWKIEYLKDVISWVAYVAVNQVEIKLNL